jgi:pilus assembly protein CpaB
MKSKTLVLMLVAIGCGLVASVVTSKYLGGTPPEQKQEEEISVLVAKQQINNYTPLSDGNVFEVKLFRKSDVARDALGNFDKIKGRMLRNPLAQGKQLTEGDLLPAGQEPLVARLRDGERLMSVKVTPETAADGFILPGFKVDVVATQMRSSEGEPYSKTILQDVEVLAVDQKPQLPDGTIAKTADRVVLRVTLKQAEMLSIFADTGLLRLVVRRSDDNKIAATTGSTTSGARQAPPRENPTSPTLDPTTSSVVIGPTVTVPAVPTKPEPETPTTRKHRLTIVNGGASTHEFEVNHETGEPVDPPNDKPNKDRGDGKKPERRGGEGSR